MSNLVMIHANHARIDGDVLTIDRKFHIGMKDYAEKINAPLVTLHPQAARDASIMDPVELKVSELPYRIVTIPYGGNWRPLPSAIPLLRKEISMARLVYGGYGDGMGAAAIALACGVLYILILEYDLKTQIMATTMQVNGKLRRAIRAMRATWSYYKAGLPEMRRAHSVHCNGYPIYDVAMSENLNALLYLDSRMSSDMIMLHEELSARLAERRGKPLRLLYSGRYEAMKGAVDAVKVGLECLAMGIEIEMHCYGQGSLAAEMRELAKRSSSRIVIHDAVPYPDLVKIARTFDVFVCCHVQNDPSCTYLESFGAGLPIVGYANRMWERLCDASGAGLCSPIGKPHLVAADIRRLTNHATLIGKSVQALDFARAHSYETEHGKRIEALNEVLAEGA
jgi:colanic acid/amylovoran biosynthesis glycosyltransferase